MFTNTGNFFKGYFEGIKSHFGNLGEDFQHAIGRKWSSDNRTVNAAVRVFATMSISVTSAALLFSATTAVIANPAVLFTVTSVAMSVLAIVISYDIIVMANNKDSWSPMKMFNHCDGTLLEPIWKDLAVMIKKH